MTKKCVVVYEAPADHAIATELADRVLVEKVPWMETGLLDSQREWIGDEPDGPLTWKGIPGRARDLGMRVHGHFSGEPALPDAQAGRRAIAYVLKRFDSIDAIVLIRDMDNEPQRRAGLEQARAVYDSVVRIAIGTAIIERECWVICGFEANGEAEQKRLDSERQRLGFNPCEQSHQLTAGNDDQATRSPKRVLAELTGRDGPRQRQCWQVTALSVLESRGTQNGLAQFMQEVEERLVPLITGREENPN